MDSPTAENSFRSSSSFSGLLSFCSDDSYTCDFHAPFSEHEEIPSFRWLSEISSIPTPQMVPPRAPFVQMKSSGYPQLDLFHIQVAEMLYSLAGEERHPVVRLCYLRRLVEAFVFLDKRFKAAVLVVLDHDHSLLRRPSIRRLLADLFDHTIGLLDICSDVSHALDSLHFCQTYAEIAASALNVEPDMCEPPLDGAPLPMDPQFRRARKALSNLLAFLDIEQNDRTPSPGKERAWFIGRGGGGGGGSSRSSGAVSENMGSGDLVASRFARLSFSRGNTLTAAWEVPRDADARALAMAIYAMNAVLTLVEWFLVLAFPCQVPGGNDTPLAVAMKAGRSLVPPWKAPWTGPMVILQEWITEEWRERRDQPGPRAASSPVLLGELQSLVRCGRSAGTPIEDWQWEDVGRELAATCRDIEQQLGPLNQQMRGVFEQLLGRMELLGRLRDAAWTSTE